MYIVYNLYTKRYIGFQSMKEKAFYDWATTGIPVIKIHHSSLPRM